MSQSRSRRGFRPQIENLEAREVPAIIAGEFSLSPQQEVFRVSQAHADVVLKSKTGAIVTTAKADANLVVSTTARFALDRAFASFAPAAIKSPVAGWAKGGPQPEPPTKAARIAVEQAPKAGILIGMLKPQGTSAVDAAFHDSL